MNTPPMCTNLFKSLQLFRACAAGSFLVLAAPSAIAVEYDLSLPGSQTYTVAGDVGGDAIVSDDFLQPAGTGVFQPFLTLDANGQTSTGSKMMEQAYNTDGFTALYMDQHRPQWNNLLTVGDLAEIEMGGLYYYGFLLDANEPGRKKSVISVDNVRIYTSPSDNTGSVGDDVTKLDLLGDLRWALNDPTLNPDSSFNNDDWIRLDEAQENVEAGTNASNGGSGKSDMALLVPVTAFSGASVDDYVWFYNLNGVHYSAEKDLAAQSGYEEWRAVVAPRGVNSTGSTLVFLAMGIAVVFDLRRRFSR